MSRFAAPSEHDRGQILVVGAFAIALLIVALAVVLNGAAFTENLATDGDGGAAQDALRFERDAKAGVAGTMVTVNRKGNAKNDLEPALTEAVEDWEALTNAEASTRGMVVEVEVASGSASYGSRIAQANDSRQFTDANGTANWTVVDGTEKIALFEMALNRSALANETDADQFTVTATNGTTDWSATFVDNGSAIVATVDGPSGTETCTVATNATVVDFVDGRIGNQTCSGLAIASQLDGPYTIGFEDATEATGTFELVVDKVISPDARFGAGGPTLTDAIWEVSVRISYDSARISYQTLFTVTVGDAHA